MTLYLQHLALMRPLQLPVVKVAGHERPATFTFTVDTVLRAPDDG